MIIERPGIKRDDERKRREIQRIVYKSLIEKPDRVQKNADRRYGQAQDQIAIPDALYHLAVSRCLDVRAQSFSKLSVQCNNVPIAFGGLLLAGGARQSVGQKESEIYG